MDTISFYCSISSLSNIENICVSLSHFFFFIFSQMYRSNNVLCVCFHVRKFAERWQFVAKKRVTRQRLNKRYRFQTGERVSPRKFLRRELHSRYLIQLIAARILNKTIYTSFLSRCTSSPMYQSSIMNVEQNPAGLQTVRPRRRQPFFFLFFFSRKTGRAEKPDRALYDHFSFIQKPPPI